MTRQREFLALIGDVRTGRHPSTNAQLASIHQYFVTNQRVGNYGEIQEARSEERARLLAQLEAAQAALNEFDAS